MGIICGAFVPAAAYCDVQPVFWLFRQCETGVAAKDDAMLQRYYAARDALELFVTMPDGGALPVQTVHIDDYLAELGECQITVWTNGSPTILPEGRQVEAE